MFLLRSIWTIPIEVAGDAVRKFYAAAEIARTGDWAILLQNHHTMRWSIAIPQVVITWIVGTRYEAYYILPLLGFALSFVIILYALKDHLNTSQKILLGVLIFVDPMSFRNSSQLMTAGPSIFFAISACYVLATYSKRNRFALVIAAALFFCAYGAQATSISFAAGGFLWLALIQRSWKSSFLFAGTLLCLLLIECLFFNYLSGWNLTFGRVEALIFGPHLEDVIGAFGAPGEPYNGRYTVAFRHLFTRWFQLPLLDIALSATFFISGVVFISLKKSRTLPAFISCAYLVGLCFALFVSFAVVSIDPITPIQGLLPRYLSPFLPFATINSVYFLTFLTEQNRKTWDVRMVILAALLAFSIILIPQAYDHSARPYIKIRTAYFLWHANSEYTAFAKEFYDGELIFTGRKKRVLLMIAQFKYPVEKLNWNSKRGGNGVSVAKRSSNALCVSKLEKIPLRRSYQKCNAAVEE